MMALNGKYLKLQLKQTKPVNNKTIVLLVALILSFVYLRPNFANAYCHYCIGCTCYRDPDTNCAHTADCECESRSDCCPPTPTPTPTCNPSCSCANTLCPWQSCTNACGDTCWGSRSCVCTPGTVSCANHGSGEGVYTCNSTGSAWIKNRSCTLGCQPDPSQECNYPTWCYDTCSGCSAPDNNQIRCYDAPRPGGSLVSTMCVYDSSCSVGCHPHTETCGGNANCAPYPGTVSHIDNCGGLNCAAPCGSSGGGSSSSSSGGCTPTNPDTPTQTSPTDGQILSKVSSVVMDWNSAAAWGDECGYTTRSYNYCVSTNSTDPCNGGDPLTTDEATTNATYSQSMPGTYYWRVQTVNGAGYNSAWSPIWSFTINNNAPSAASMTCTGEVPATTASPVTFSATVTDADGGDDIDRVYLGFNTCSNDPGDANWYNFEHTFANYFGGMGASTNWGVRGASNANAACTGTVGSPTDPWAAIPGNNVPGSVTYASVSNSIAGNNYTQNFSITTNGVTPGQSYYCYGMTQDLQGLWQTGSTTPSWTRLNQICVEGFSGTNPSYVTAWSDWGNCGAAGAHKRSRTRTCTEDCTATVNDCDTYLAEGGAQDCGTECTYNAGTNTQTQVQDCTGVITGTLYDASDVSSCPALSTVIGPGTFSITSLAGYPLVSPASASPATISVNASGQYSFTGYSPDTFTYDFTDLLNAGLIGNATPKFSCTSASASLSNSPVGCMTQPCETGASYIYNFGFWRKYGGWWQVVGGPVYARQNIQSTIPASLPGNMYLILPGTTAHQGLAVYGGSLTLGSNPNAQVNANNTSVQSVYNSNSIYNYEFFRNKLSGKTADTWSNKNQLPAYSDGSGKGYMLLRSTDGTASNFSSPINVAAGEKYVLLTTGNVNISDNITIASGGTLIIITDQSINFSAAVTRADGWYLADSMITIASTGDETTEQRFLGNGSFVAHGGIVPDRDRGVTNNIESSSLFTYRTDLLQNAPDAIKFPYQRYAPYVP